MTSISQIQYFPANINDEPENTGCNPTCDNCSIRHASMCSALKDDELFELSEISSDKSIKAKQNVCSEGEDAEYLYNIREGCVRISKMLSDGRRQIIGFLFPGEFFGLACAKGYNYSAEAITDIELCRMKRSEVFKKFIEIPKLSEKILDITRTELQCSQEQMLLLGRKNAKEKLCTFLVNMHKKSASFSVLTENQIFLPMSRADIADYLGLTIETVSRQFTILAKDGIIGVDKSPLVKVLDEERMKLIASCE